MGLRTFDDIPMLWGLQFFHPREIIAHCRGLPHMQLHQWLFWGSKMLQLPSTDSVEPSGWF